MSHSLTVWGIHAHHFVLVTFQTLDQSIIITRPNLDAAIVTSCRQIKAFFIGWSFVVLHVCNQRSVCWNRVYVAQCPHIPNLDCVIATCWSQMIAVWHKHDFSILCPYPRIILSQTYPLGFQSKPSTSLTWPSSAMADRPVRISHTRPTQSRPLHTLLMTNASS